MGTLLIKKYQNNNENMPKAYKKWYGRLIHRGTLGTSELAEHIMKHGTVYTEDVVIGVITKMKNCIQEMLADGYKVKLDGIGTLYPKVTSKGVADAKDFSAQDDITRVGISFLADQSKKSLYKASATRNATSLSTQLYSELTGEDGLTNNPSTTGEGSGTTNPSNGTNGGNTGGSTGGNDGGGGNDTGGGFESGGD